MNEFSNPDTPDNDGFHGVLTFRGRGYIYGVSSSRNDKDEEVHSLLFMRYFEPNYLDFVCVFTDDRSLTSRSTGTRGQSPRAR